MWLVLATLEDYKVRIARPTQEQKNIKLEITSSRDSVILNFLSSVTLLM